MRLLVSTFSGFNSPLRTRPLAFGCLMLLLPLLLISVSVEGADTKNFKFTNNTGQPASDLHVTYSGTGGDLTTVVIANPAGCPAPNIPSNGKSTNTMVVDWGVACVPNGASVTVNVTTIHGPLQVMGGFWTDPENQQDPGIGQLDLETDVEEVEGNGQNNQIGKGVQEVARQVASVPDWVLWTALAILAVTALLLYLMSRQLIQRVRNLKAFLLQSYGFIDTSLFEPEKLDFVRNESDWEIAENHKDNVHGNFDGLGNCPCQKEYNLNSTQTFFPNKPNQQQLQNCLNNPPATPDAEWECPNDCIQVMTHKWNSYMLMRNKKTGQYMLNCNAYAQFHCKKPDDPDAQKDPVEGPPPPDVVG